jgi:hypothetical protein
LKFRIPVLIPVRTSTFHLLSSRITTTTTTASQLRLFSLIKQNNLKIPAPASWLERA